MKENLEHEIPKGILGWYQFHKEDRILMVGEECPEVSEMFRDMADTCLISTFTWCKSEQELDALLKSDHKYDVIVAIKLLETVQEPVDLLKNMRKVLAPCGRLLLAMNNRMGIRYFCGDRDPYTGRNFDSIENYRRYAVKKEDVLSGRMYDKNELQNFLIEADLKTQKFYSVFPDIEHPSFIFADGYIPNEELNIRVFPMYYSPDTVFLEEEYLYTDLIRNGMFHNMANAYLIECYAEDNITCSNIEQVTMSLDRGTEYAVYTIIRGDAVVEKKPVYAQGKKRLEKLIQHAEDLKNHGVNVVDAQMNGDFYIMPFIKAENALAYLRRMAKMNPDLFIEAMDRFWNTILQSSNINTRIENQKEITFFEKGYIDLVPLNCFVQNEEYLFYDQEFCIEDCPVGVLVTRFVDLVYAGNLELERILPRSFFYKRYGIMEDVKEYQRIANKFLCELRKEKELKVYHEKYRRNPETVNANRQRMNYSSEEYNKRFVDVFQDLGDKKIILFGSGAFTKRFLAMYGKQYDVETIIDNNPERWGQTIDGFTINSPDYFRENDKEQYKVLICIKSYLSVARQLEELGISDYGIFDSGRSYARNTYKQETQPNKLTDKGEENKKYRTGYVAGVFDMFHIGHVRLLQKAKEQCEYLIVGVVPDEDCYKQKSKYPIIPCEERVEVLKSCKYVDRVEVLPTGFGGIRDAYKMFQFDVQFSGDDHGTEGNWLADKEYLNKHGADLVFFDYTKETSSTEIRNRIQ